MLKYLFFLSAVLATKSAFSKEFAAEYCERLLEEVPKSIHLDSILSTEPNLEKCAEGIWSIDDQACHYDEAELNALKRFAHFQKVKGSPWNRLVKVSHYAEKPVPGFDAVMFDENGWARANLSLKSSSLTGQEGGWRSAWQKIRLHARKSQDFLMKPALWIWARHLYHQDKSEFEFANQWQIPDIADSETEQKALSRLWEIFGVPYERSRRSLISVSDISGFDIQELWETAKYDLESVSVGESNGVKYLKLNPRLYMSYRLEPSIARQQGRLRNLQIKAQAVILLAEHAIEITKSDIKVYSLNRPLQNDPFMWQALAEDYEALAKGYEAAAREIYLANPESEEDED